MDTTVVDINACEFGYELIIVVPYVYYLHSNNIDVTVITGKGMKPFYFFLPEESIVEKYIGRQWNFPSNTPLKGVQFRKLNKRKWISPNFKEYYSNNFLIPHSSKPSIFIFNKFTDEWAGPPVNFLGLEVIDSLFTTLQKKYRIIYSRPGSDVVLDDRNQISYELNEYDLIRRKYPETILISDIADSSNFNTVQLSAASTCSHFISVQGGPSVFCSLFGGENIIYAVKGKELEVDAYSWYSEFSSCKITTVSTYDNLLLQAKKL